jgi:DNA repair protein RadA/Sms
VTAAPVALAAVDVAHSARRATGVAELDRVLGGGLVPGSVTLLGGEPGIGKSTMVLQALASMAAAGTSCLLVSAEESSAQVRWRAARLGPLPTNLWVLAETSLPAVVAAVESTRPSVCVVDSIQTVGDPSIASSPGSVAQVRHCAGVLTALAKRLGGAMVLVGHVTKDGTLAGPRALEHVVDSVLSFEGDRHQVVRILRALKHRFGPTGEVGLFEMGEAGLVGVADPGGLFLGDRRPGVPGSVVVATVEGRRTLMVEVQALVGRTARRPRTATQGVDAGRVALLLAVLSRKAGLDLTDCDVFVSAVGGARLSEPAADLAVALAVVSAAVERALPADLVAVGEIGLAGEVRRVPDVARRLSEAARLGFGKALVGATAPDAGGLAVRRVRTVGDALACTGLASGAGPRTTPGGEGRVGAPRPARPTSRPPYRVLAGGAG